MIDTKNAFEVVGYAILPTPHQVHVVFLGFADNTEYFERYKKHMRAELPTDFPHEVRVQWIHFDPKTGVSLTTVEEITSALKEKKPISLEMWVESPELNTPAAQVMFAVCETLVRQSIKEDPPSRMRCSLAFGPEAYKVFERERREDFITCRILGKIFEMRRHNQRKYLDVCSFGSNLHGPRVDSATLHFWDPTE